MIALVWSKPPSDDDKTDSWWAKLARLPREQWWAGVEAEYAERLKNLSAVPEPTAKKINPRFKGRWERRKREQKLEGN